MAIAVGVGAIALVVFVVLLFVNRGPSYEYEDYEPPPISTEPPDEIHIPASDEEALELTQNNPLYQAVLPENVNCEMPVASVTELSPEEMQDHLNELSACLMRVWDRPTAEVGITIFRPNITVYTDDVVTACGTAPGDDPNAFYCSGDQMLYYAYALTSHPATASIGTTPMAVEAVLAHEFGHFLQGRAGISGGYAWRKYYEESDEEVLQLGRRSELQADCLAGNWIRPNEQSTGLDQAGLAAIAEIFYSLGDGSDPAHRDHGAPDMRSQWFNTGAGTPNVSVCNTWVVDADQVR